MDADNQTLSAGLSDQAPSAMETPRTRKWAGRVRRTGLCCLGFAVFLMAIYAFRSPILRELATIWIVDEPLAKADAVVVLGGGLESRPFEAARLYHAGLAPKVLFMDVKLSPTTKLGITPSEEELTRKTLLKQGVAETDLVVIGQSVASTFDESMAVRNWVQTNHARRIIIPTDLFHTRRVRWLFRKELKGTGTQVSVKAVSPPNYTATDWWHHEEGLIAFQNEIIKFAYYWAKY
jgi:uncharacterized SAM-binding protein YcdF (DUF218 family)